MSSTDLSRHHPPEEDNKLGASKSFQSSVYFKKG